MPPRHVVLISCVKSKQAGRARADELYIGTWFPLALRYARSLRPDALCILSAKHGLLDPGQSIEPYDATLNRMRTGARRAWADRVCDALGSRFDLASDRFTILAGHRYREFLLPRLRLYEIPMLGLSQGRQLRFLKEQAMPHDGRNHLSGRPSVCAAIHEAARRLTRFQFPFDSARLPPDGIYFLFEKGEHGHGGKRIVRIGSHNGQGRLALRLIEHFMKPNKDRSIFRKNIGRALLAAENDPFIEQWNISLTKRANRDRYAAGIDGTKLAAVEQAVTSRITEQFSFSVISVEDRAQRLRLEAQLIATVAQCGQCCPSETWFGLSSPEAVIRKCGLWQKQHVGGVPLLEVPKLFAEPLSGSEP